MIEHSASHDHCGCFCNLDLGIAAAHRPHLYQAMWPILDLMQTLTHFRVLNPDDGLVSVCCQINWNRAILQTVSGSFITPVLKIPRMISSICGAGCPLAMVCEVGIWFDIVEFAGINERGNLLNFTDVFLCL